MSRHMAKEELPSSSFLPPLFPLPLPSAFLLLPTSAYLPGTARASLWARPWLFRLLPKEIVSIPCS